MVLSGFRVQRSCQACSTECDIIPQRKLNFADKKTEVKSIEMFASGTRANMWESKGSNELQ